MKTVQYKQRRFFEYIYNENRVYRFNTKWQFLSNYDTDEELEKIKEDFLDQIEFDDHYSTVTQFRLLENDVEIQKSLKHISMSFKSQKNRDMQEELSHKSVQSQLWRRQKQKYLRKQ